MRAIRRLAKSEPRQCVNCLGRPLTWASFEGSQLQLESQLQSTAQHGCRTCDFWHCVIRCFHSDPQKPVKIEEGEIYFDNQPFEVFRIPGGVLSDKYFGVEVGCLFLSEGTSSESTFIRIRDWFDECKKHPLCNTRGSPQFFMPKRILSLADNRVSLQEGARPNRYACLSHCWGKSNPPLKTLKATIEEHKKDIPWQMLSKTFQDAVDICRRLGVEYLWIDSLCIIQDSEQDWNQEAVRMGDIYSHAHFTIAATASEDGSGGCYRDKDPANVDIRTVVEGSVYLRKQVPELYPKLYSTDYRTTHALLRRAWALQEMLLSRRVIHFTETEVIWQCDMCQLAESIMESISFAADPSMFWRDLVNEGNYKENQWRSLVSEYSGLQLSLESDRLPALAAISQRVYQVKATQVRQMIDHKLEDDCFLGGLWLNSLFLDLLWTRHDPVKPETVKRKTEYGMPSWSWASLQVQVEWKNMDLAKPLGCVCLVAANVVPIESPYLGKYSRAELILEGPVIRTTLKNLEGDEHGCGFYQDFELSDSQLTLLPLALREETVSQYSDPQKGTSTLEYRGPFIIFLVLRRREDGRTYERVGVLQHLLKKNCLDVQRRLSRPKWIELYLGVMGVYPLSPSSPESRDLNTIESNLSKLPREEVVIT